MTTNKVLGCEIVLMSGEILRIGGKCAENAGYDLMGIITGSEGLLGVITEITVRILQKPETARALMVGFDRKGTRVNCSHSSNSSAVFCLKKITPSLFHSKPK